MKIAVESMGRCELVTVSGQLNSATARDFEEKLLSLCRAGLRNLVVNMRDVTLITSAGIRSLLSVQIKVRRMIPAGDVVLSEIPDFAQEALEMVGLHHLFKTYSRDVTAVGSF